MYKLLGGVIVGLVFSNVYFWHGKSEALEQIAEIKREALIVQYQAIAEKNVIENKSAERLTTLRARYVAELEKVDSKYSAVKSVRVRDTATSSQNRMPGVSGTAEVVADTGRIRFEQEYSSLKSRLEKCALSYNTLYESWRESCLLHSCTTAPVVH